MREEGIHASLIMRVVEDQFFTLVIARNGGVRVDRHGASWVFAKFQNSQIAKISYCQRGYQGEENSRASVKH